MTFYNFIYFLNNFIKMNYLLIVVICDKYEKFKENIYIFYDVYSDFHILWKCLCSRACK